MDYVDRVYGKIQIGEPVILELMNCKTIQRLKGIDQAGYFTPFFPGTEQSRFEHSVGVYLLLKIYGASLEERVAGLIHDASHSAFSHCVDYVLDAGSQEKQSHQDDIFDGFIRKSEIPVILKKYKIDTDYILDESKFPLKENDLPDLCADRIDYALRTGLVFGRISSPNYFLDDLSVIKNKWVFKSFESARDFAKLFFHLNSKYFSALVSAVMLRSVGDYIGHALKNGYIDESDLYATDSEVLEKVALAHANDDELQKLFSRMNNKVRFESNNENYDVEVVCKSRAVDPLCLSHGKMARVSEIDPNWGKIMESESRPKTYRIKFDN
jgi:HD superfamily phosphohydrolase